ncbi:MAG: hypothetical protein WDW38_009529 [Sanguina aurantia]
MWLWKAADLFMSRTKPAVDITYRSVGTAVGVFEFLGNTSSNSTAPYADFSTGDMPLTLATYNSLTVARNLSVMQIPMLLATVSFFHTVPGVGGGSNGLSLLPCTLARIYAGIITTWDNAEILASNPLIASIIPPGTPIVALRRSKASGSTAAVSAYLNVTCPTLWSTPAGPGYGYDTSLWNATASTAISTTATLMSTFGSTAYAIGYVDSGEGLQLGLNEVIVTNRNGTALTSAQADPTQLGTAFNSITNAIDADWSSVTYLPTPASKSWPMNAVVYLYLRKDLTFLGASGGLLQALVNYLLSDDAQALLPLYHQVAIPSMNRTMMLTAFNAMASVSASAPMWTFENSSVAQPGTGEGNYVVSAMRNTYHTSELFALENEVDNIILPALTLGNVYQVHGSGSWYPSTFLRTVEHFLSSWARLPVTFTYRVISSFQAQAEFRSTTEMFTNMNHFKVSDFPLSSADYSTLKATANVSRCVGHGIQQLESLLSSNYSAPITVFGYPTANSNTFAMATYLAKNCPSVWTLGSGSSGVVAWPAAVKTTTARGNNISSPWDMSGAISSTPYSIGFLESEVQYLQGQYGYMPHLYEAQLQLANGSYASSTQVDLTQAGPQILNSTAVPSNANYAIDITGDWSGVDTSIATVWPIVSLSYLISYQNLTLYGASGPLLKAMLGYLLTDEAQGYMTRFASGGSPMPSAARAVMATQVRLLTIAPYTSEWQLEDRNVFGPGSSLTSLSKNRGDWTTTQLYLQNMQITTLQVQLTAALPTLVRVLGVNEMSNLTGRMLADVTGMAASPVRLTYEVSPSSQAAIDTFVSAGNSYAGYHDMLILDSALPTAAWAAMNAAGVRVVQTPIFLQAVGLYYNGSGASLLQTDDMISNYNFTACTLAKIWNGSVTMWNDPAIAADNPNANLPAVGVQFGYAASETFKLTALYQYISAGCNSTVKLSTTPIGAALAFGTQDLLAAYIQANPIGLLGVMSRMYGKPYNLTLGQVQSQYMYPPNKMGALNYSASTKALFLRPGTAPAGVPQATYLLQPLLDIAMPRLPTDDWSSFSLVWADAQSKGYYPMMTCAFAISRADLTSMALAGGLLKGVLAYMLDPWQQKLADLSAAGRLAGGTGMAVPTPAMGASAQLAGAVATAALRLRLAKLALPQLQIVQNAVQWPLANSRAAVNGSPNAIIMTLWKALDYQDSLTSQSDTVSRLLANQLQMLQAAKTVQDNNDAQLQKVQGIAVAGIVLAVILSYGPLSISMAIKTGLEIKYRMNLSSGFGANKNWPLATSPVSSRLVSSRLMADYEELSSLMSDPEMVQIPAKEAQGASQQRLPVPVPVPVPVSVPLVAGFGSPAPASSPAPHPTNKVLDFGVKQAADPPTTPTTPFTLSSSTEVSPRHHTKLHTRSILDHLSSPQRAPVRPWGLVLTLRKVDYNQFLLETLLWRNKVRSTLYFVLGLAGLLGLKYAVSAQATLLSSEWPPPRLCPHQRRHQGTRLEPVSSPRNSAENRAQPVAHTHGHIGAPGVLRSEPGGGQPGLAGCIAQTTTRAPLGVGYVLLLSLFVNFMRAIISPPWQASSKWTGSALANFAQSSVKATLSAVFSLHDAHFNGQDPVKTLQVAVGLWSVALLGRHVSGINLLVAGFLLAFTLPVLYAKFRRMVDKTLGDVLAQVQDRQRMHYLSLLLGSPEQAAELLVGIDAKHRTCSTSSHASPQDEYTHLVQRFATTGSGRVEVLEVDHDPECKLFIIAAQHMRTFSDSIFGTSGAVERLQDVVDAAASAGRMLCLLHTAA